MMSGYNKQDLETQVKPIPLEPFVEKMMKMCPDMPKEKVIVEAKKAIQKEYQELLAFHQRIAKKSQKQK